ncbi:UBA/TS-N domain-containing protein [Cucurbitaria berberidis CBS 394.84]|uniref:UBA/TS-N domain-containing protein n=1 Tax=Cucurbitaria berberidis CBS 394.84 TaxID=1168544 RepID=A0A9P4LAC5_9PLEO|nr:UBA/TS-N domain-containing protein [Cucurbitaria berberidis CBS 394.84]KAF1847925.1 UBA/TS-N domain-containing protein [Cucurbitaria berberidis CBS 394.84]
MDDLNSLDWSQPAKKTVNTPAVFPPFRQSPTPQLSGRSTPLSTLSAQQSGAGASLTGNHAFKAPSKPATPANDSFAGLVSLNTSKASTSNLSLQERQKQIQEEKSRHEAERRKQYDATFGGADSKHWDTLGSGKSTPEPTAFGAPRPPITTSGSQGLSRTINKPFAGLDTTSKRPALSSPAEEDLLAAFNSAAPVDNSSHFPFPSHGSGRSTPAYGSNVSRNHTPLPQPSSNSNTPMDDDDDDDDMFGLKQMAQKSVSPAPPPQANDGDDDILGLLGKPVSEFERKEQPSPVVEEARTEGRRRSPPGPQNAHDKAVAELVDMGFTADKSAIALATTESGLDVQVAVGWLLNQAHAEAKQKTQNRSQDRSRRSPDEFVERPRQSDNRPNARETSRDARAGGSKPAWMRDEEGRSRSSQRRQEDQPQEKDVTQMASEIGNNLFKSANSLWKTGRKQVQKAMADLQQDGDNNVPKWMRDAQAAEAAPKSSRTQREQQAATDEAMMLEAGGRPIKPSRQSEVRQQAEPLPVRQRREQEGGRNGFPDRMSSQSPSQRQQTSSLDKRPATRLTRQDVEERSPQAYVSPARRKKSTPQPQVDLFSPEPTPSSQSSRQPTLVQSKNPFLQATSTPKARSPAVTPPPPRPKAPPRQIPPVSSSALNSSASDRQRGSEAFKRGDYSAAHAAYSSALSPLPQSHPVTIVVLCNRAVTNIKVGDPKAAIVDANAALAIIGVSRGEGEKIATGGTEGDKDMKEFYGKALMRKAEALENMEKWADAHTVWKEAVQNGVGGAISIQGRNRCEKAASGGNTSAAPAAAKRPPPARKPAAPKPTALSDLGSGPANDSEAVKKLKAANAAAERADDEKFALTDQVDAKLIAWKGTKSDNLRALLGSLDKVLWEEAGWKKVNMGDLVMPNKVKIVYMKAIAKVHPDKISQAATTEQKMISAAVFATLNEAWDKFKTDNNL